MLLLPVVADPTPDTLRGTAVSVQRWGWRSEAPFEERQFYLISLANSAKAMRYLCNETPFQLGSSRAEKTLCCGFTGSFSTLGCPTRSWGMVQCSWSSCEVLAVCWVFLVLPHACLGLLWCLVTPPWQVFPVVPEELETELGMAAPEHNLPQALPCWRIGVCVWVFNCRGVCKGHKPLYKAKQDFAM